MYPRIHTPSFPSQVKEGLAKTSEERSTKQDDAHFVNSSNGLPRYITAEDNARILRKIDLHIMPIMAVIYFLQYMDKQTLSISSVFGIIHDANLIGREYSVLGSIVSIAQLLLQPLSAYFLVKFRLSIYIPVIVTCWGITLAGMSAAKGFIGLLIGRFLLGAFESSIQSAFILVGQLWYRRHEQGFRVAIWYSNLGWVNIFGSLIMYGIGHIHSAVLFHYQIIFLLLGCITVLVGFASFFIFPDNPARCRFLSKEDKAIATERLRANNQGLENKSFKVSQAIEMITDLKSWCWMILTFLISLPSSGISSFGPLIIKGFGFDGSHVMLFNIPFGALQISSIFAAFWVAKRLRMKSLVVLALLIPCITGTVLLLRLGRSHQDLPGLLVAYYILASYSSIIPLIFNWQSSNVAGHTKKATTTAFMTMGTVSGGIVGPLLFTPQDKPYYTRGLKAMLACFCSCFLVVCCTAAYLRYLNNRNKQRRVLAGKRAEIVDYSMLSVQEIEAVQARETGQEAGGGIHSMAMERDERREGFEDLTDLQNDEFIYVY